MSPIGTKHPGPPDSLCEQRGLDGTYHQRMPWPGQDMGRLQDALLDPPREEIRWYHIAAVPVAMILAVLSVWGIATMLPLPK